MSGDFGSDLIVLTDDDGEEFELEHLDTLEHGGETFMAFIPADTKEDDEEVSVIILKVVEEDGEEALVTIEDESEMEKIYTLFMERLEGGEDLPEA